ncbi:structural constituent of epidermis [Cichlidogyrus casuarinus]|uniref:Structural constituent of epidermis n=1 Tax=Cichlidogyrus casuarinus TaxID=1844966 RepID=A0ABD2QJW3_9PLAT
MLKKIIDTETAPRTFKTVRRGLRRASFAGIKAIYSASDSENKVNKATKLLPLRTLPLPRQDPEKIVAVLEERSAKERSHFEELWTKLMKEIENEQKEISVMKKGILETEEGSIKQAINERKAQITNLRDHLKTHMSTNEELKKCSDEKYESDLPFRHEFMDSFLNLNTKSQQQAKELDELAEQIKKSQEVSYGWIQGIKDRKNTMLSSISSLPVDAQKIIFDVLRQYEESLSEVKRRSDYVLRTKRVNKKILELKEHNLDSRISSLLKDLEEIKQMSLPTPS